MGRAALSVLAALLLLPGAAFAGGPTGLWAGNAVLSSVGVGAAAPTGTPAELAMQIILHVDAAGKVRLLKEAILVKDPVDGHAVIVTDDTLLSRYSGIERRAGTAIGRRLSSVSYDFHGQAVDCAGSMATGDQVVCSFALGRDGATNPFLHRYNRNHDGLDPLGSPIPASSPDQEVYAVGRVMTLRFQARYPADQRLPAGPAPPGWGDSQVGGVFSEVLTGLRREPISVSGSFSLVRVSEGGVLNE